MVDPALDPPLVSRPVERLIGSEDLVRFRLARQGSSGPFRGSLVLSRILDSPATEREQQGKPERREDPMLAGRREPT